MAGSGTMTPVTPGIGVGAVGGQPLPYTLLSIDRYAQIMGINPMHFRRGCTPAVSPMVMPVTSCDTTWFKYDWQDKDKVSWMQLANLIKKTEQEVASLAGYWPAPVWIEEEFHTYPRPYRRPYYGIGKNPRGDMKGTETTYGKVTNGGVRAVALIGSATVGGGSLAYTDEDSDGFYETATIVLPTTLTNANEIKVYYSNMSGRKEWEIRPVRSITISGGNVTIVLPSWLLIDPDLYEDLPTEYDLSCIDISTVSNFVSTVDVYREYTDTTTRAVEFGWETSCSTCGGTGCVACSLTTQDGCIYLRDSDAGIVVPVPAAYDADNAQWISANWEGGVEPDTYKVWYRSGAQDQDFISGATHDPLSVFWAQVISWIVTARLERPLCDCGNVHNLSEHLRIDLSLNTRESSYFTPELVHLNPLGTRRGEVMAWREIMHTVKDKKLEVMTL